MGVCLQGEEVCLRGVCLLEGGSAYREGGWANLPHEPEIRNAFMLGCFMASFVISRSTLRCSDWMSYDPIMQVLDQSGNLYYQCRHFKSRAST